MAAWTIPPFPHPLPERRIGILPTEQGLLVYPRSSTHVAGNRHHPIHHFKASTAAAPAANSSNRPYGSGDGFKVATIGASHAPSSSTSAAPVAATGALPSLTSLDVGFLIDWTREAKITPLAPPAWSSLLDSASSDEPTLECSGIIGLSRFFNSSYLFVITGSKLIGHYFHDTRPIYCCTGVLAIPLLQQEATQAIRAQLTKQGSPPTPSAQPSSHRDDADVSDSKDQSDSESEGDTESSESDYDDVETPAAIPREPFFSSLPASQRSDTLRVPKSRPWLTRAARAVSDSRIETISEDADTQAKLADASVHAVDMTDEPEVIPIPDPVVDAEVHDTSAVAATPDEQWHAAKQAELEDKAVRETAKYWARGEFWFSYDFDLTTSLQNKRRALDKSARSDSGAAPRSMPRPLHPTQGSASDASDSTTHFPLLAEPYPNLPLWRRADRRFWHNEHMSRDFVHAGLHAYILPVMQGYLQTVSLPVRPQDAPEAYTASTEAKDDKPVVRCQLMVISRRSKERAGLRYQRRGINEAGQVANFVETEQLVYVLRSRAEQGGKEGAISKAYRAAAEKLRDEDVAGGSGKTWDRKKVHYVDFDFHKECSGMRFENVAKLIAQMEPTLAQMKYYHHRSVGAAKADVEVLNTQTGVFRVSCLDCLDRTNVVQSAFARHVLTGQFAKLGIRVGDPVSSSASAAETAAK
ncbi:hypothetical protein L1887_56518 [Cichorium endivia]|nr:hypothetical protein L1887_56518 [Cichorium endivia]